MKRETNACFGRLAMTRTEFYTRDFLTMGLEDRKGNMSKPQKRWLVSIDEKCLKNPCDKTSVILDVMMPGMDGYEM